VLNIRTTTRKDIIPLARIYIKAYMRPAFGEHWNNQSAIDMLMFYYTQKAFLGLTALVNNKIVGAFFSYIKPWHDGKHLAEGELFVDPKYQKQKIGRQLFLEMMQLADKKKCIQHELLAYNLIAKWYRKVGLKNTGIIHMSGEIKHILKKLGP
jgi:GNAT superfamily N-acetyltransferase